MRSKVDTDETDGPTFKAKPVKDKGLNPGENADPSVLQDHQEIDEH